MGDCLLSSSFLSYTGAFTFNYRHAMVYEVRARRGAPQGRAGTARSAVR